MTVQVEEALNVCQKFKVLNSSLLYPVSYPSWQRLFDDNLGWRVVNELEQTAFSVHFWNKLSHIARVDVNSTKAYALMARKYCPTVTADIVII